MITEKKIEYLLGDLNTFAGEKDKSRLLQKLWIFSKEIDGAGRIDYLYSINRSNRVLFAHELASQIDNLRKRITEKYAIKKTALDDFVDQISLVILNFTRSESLGDIDRVSKVVSDFRIREDAFVPIEDRKVIAEYNGGHFYASISHLDEKFIVSNGYLTDFMIYFDFWSQEKGWLSDKYVQLIKQIESQIGEISHLCFMYKDVGSFGPVQIVDYIKERIPEKKIFYFNLASPEEDNPFEFNGSEPPTEFENVCINYDLIFSGAGILSGSSKIRARFNCKNVSAVVLYKYPIGSSDMIDKILYKTIFQKKFVDRIFEDYRKTVLLKPNTKILNMRDEIQGILKNRSYDSLVGLFREDERHALNTLYELIKEKSLDIGKQGKDVWKRVFKFYLDSGNTEKIDEICSNLAKLNVEINKTAFMDIVEALGAGIGAATTSAHPSGGVDFQEKIKNYFIKKEARKYKKEFCSYQNSC